MTAPTTATRRDARKKQLQRLTIKDLGRLEPYKSNQARGIPGDATSENPSKAEMIEAILDHELGTVSHSP